MDIGTYKVQRKGGAAAAADSDVSFPWQERRNKEAWRWASYSALLMALVVVGGVATVQERRADDRGVALRRWATGSSGPREMPTLGAYMDGEGGSQGGGWRWGRAAAGTNGDVQPNKELADSLEREWELLHGEGAGAEEKARKLMAGAKLDWRGALGMLKRAAQMKTAASRLLSRGQADERALARREQPVVQLEAREQGAARAYRTDMLQLASLVPEEARLRRDNEPIPPSLAAKVREIDRHLRRDMTLRDMDSQRLASFSSGQGLRSTETLDGSGKGVKSLAMEDEAYRRDERAESEVHQAYKNIGIDNGIKQRSSREAAAAQKLLAKAECIRKFRQHFRFDQDEIPAGDVTSTYATILAMCQV